LSRVAESLVGGTTLHWFGGLVPCLIPQSHIWLDESSKQIKEHQIKNLQLIQWLAIDKMSMCTLDILTLLSQVARKARVDNGNMDATVPFGGLNIILMSDFHQFPLVGATNAMLYCPPVARNTATVRKVIYSQFDTVINLTKQERIQDEQWKQILHKLREGKCTNEDIWEIRKLIVNDPECEVPNFKLEPWDTAILVTPQNCVWMAWNRLSLHKHCKKTGNILYISYAEDTIGNDRQPTNLEQKVLVAGMSLDQTCKVPQRIEFAIGMQVMVVLNVATEANLANGSRGTIKDIILDT
jgi:hypothetical protein